MITDQLSLHSLRLCGETLSRVNKFHHGKTTSQRHDDNSPRRHDDTMIIHHDDTTTRRYDDAISSQAVKCSVDIPVCNDAASILSVNAHGQNAHATQCYNEQRVTNNEQRATGLQVAPQRYYDTTVIHHDDTTTLRCDDAISSQAVKCSVDIPVCNDAASILSVNAHGQNAHATQCYNEQRVTTRRHDDAIYSQGGRRGKGRMDQRVTNNEQRLMHNGGNEDNRRSHKHGLMPLRSSASSVVKNHKVQRSMNNEQLSLRSLRLCGSQALFIERRTRCAAFSLVEILVAIFVLSIGLIMIAGIFPVAVKWTADDAQTSIAQVIAKNAVATIETQYPTLNSTSAIALGPYCYNFGNSTPYPNVNPAPAAPSTTPPPGVYYWSALILPANSSIAGSGGIYPGTQANNMYTIYVFVFNKGDINNQFLTTVYSGAAPIVMQPLDIVASPYYPQLFQGPASSILNIPPPPSPPPPPPPLIPVGALGVDTTTGAVFRLIVGPTGAFTTTGSGTAVISSSDNILFAPPAIGQTASPLIYVYVTTVSL